MAEENFVFGAKAGSKLSKISPRFIMEAMMFSLIFIIIGDLAGTIYAIFYTALSTAPKVIAGISGVFGAVFMFAILVSTYQSYRSLVEILKVQKILGEAVQDVNKDLKPDIDLTKTTTDCKEVENAETKN